MGRGPEAAAGRVNTALPVMMRVPAAPREHFPFAFQIGRRPAYPGQPALHMGFAYRLAGRVGHGRD